MFEQKLSCIDALAIYLFDTWKFFHLHFMYAQNENGFMYIYSFMSVERV